MSTSHNTRDDTRENANQPTSSPVILMLGTIGDTTWRMFVPIIGSTLLGIWLDKAFVTSPWLLILSITLGCAAAALLIRSQITQINQGKK